MGTLFNNPVCAPELRNCRKGYTSVMSDSEYSSSNSSGDSNGSGQGKTPLRKDEVEIIQGKLEQWMGADATRRKSIFKDIAHTVQGLEANRTLKSNQWVVKKKVSASPYLEVLPYCVSIGN